MRTSFVWIGAVIASLTVPSQAQSPVVPFSESQTPSRWLVELSSPPSIDGTAGSALDGEESQFHAAAAAAGIRYSRSRRFRELWNGLALTATARDVSRLRSLPRVQAVYPVVSIRLDERDEPPAIVTEMITALAQTGADIAQSELGLSGRGVRVAVIDSGVDFDHPDLGGCFGPGCRVAKGYDFVGDDYDPDNEPTFIAPDPVPDDCMGHGTMVAGIIGANGGVKGVAPGVTFHAYRVFGCEGATTSEIMIAAMERARRDRSDIVNLSIGGALAWPQDPVAKAADNLVKHGVVVVAAAGNDAPLGLYASSAPGVGRNVISVASFDNSHLHTNAPSFSISPADTKIFYLPGIQSPAPPPFGAFPMARTGTTTTPDDACNPLLAESLAGQVALIRLGTCDPTQKAVNAEAAGAAGVVLYDAGGLPVPILGAATIPTVWIPAAPGALIDERLAAGAVTLTWNDPLVNVPNPTANLISSLSSYGPAPDLSLKPDIGAPGGGIRSTVPLENGGGYDENSGTSFAAPHVAGAVALLLEARPHADPEEVKARLRNSARPQLCREDPARGFLDNVHRQGAGMLRIDDAVRAGAIVTPSSLALGEIESGSVTRWLRLSRSEQDCRHDGRHGDRCNDDRRRKVTYTLGYEPALATGPNTFAPEFVASFADVQFNAATVTFGGEHRGNGDDDAPIRVGITPPPQAEGARLFGGYITFTPDDGGPVIRVPYMGYNGDYQAIQVFTLLPRLTRRTPTGFVPQPSGGTFTMAGPLDVPYIFIHLNHPVANLKLEVFDVATGNSVNLTEDRDFFPRNLRATSFWAFFWDGNTFEREGGPVAAVPNGTYRIEVSILKALGDPRNPAHVERWTSPNITVARPAPSTP